MNHRKEENKTKSQIRRENVLVLMGPSCTSQVLQTVSMLGCRVSLLASKDSGHGAGVPAKDTLMPKSVLSDVSGFREYLMRNQCMEQCAIYTFFLVGPTWDGLSSPIFPFWLFLDPVLRGEITKRSFRDWRYSILGHEDLYGWMISSYWSKWLRQGSGLSWGGILVVRDRRLKDLLSQTYLFVIGDV